MVLKINIILRSPFNVLHSVLVITSGTRGQSTGVVISITQYVMQILSQSMSMFEIEIASIFSVFAIWFCIYTCLRSLYSMAGCIQNHRMDGRTELSSTD